MENKLRVLVTGACGVTSRSIVRSLLNSKKFSKNCEFIGTDICSIKYALYEGLYTRIYKVPAYNENDYREVMMDIIAKEKVNVAIVTPEPEVLYWSEHPFDIKFMQIPRKFAKLVLSKKSLYDILINTKLIPKYQIINKQDILNGIDCVNLNFPFWIRDYSEGTTSGMGSFRPNNYEELKAWLIINPSIDNFMISEFLPGRNYACFLLFNKGKLLKTGVAERISYIMSKVSVSGITGNTSVGKLIKNEKIVTVARKGIESIISFTNESMHGLVVVDLKEDNNGNPLITEINIRHVAFTSSFASAGINFSEYQLLCILDRESEIIVDQDYNIPENNVILRDVDGLPIWVEDYSELTVGQYIDVKI